MKKYFKRFEKTIVFLLKVALYLSVFFSFYGMMAINNPQLFRISRTSAITILVFIAAGLALIKTYGTYDIGQRKSKQIIASLGLAFVITDVITYIALTIMNTNPANNLLFRFENLGMLIVSMVIQVILIMIFAYGGNYIFFALNEPEKCYVVTSGRDSCESIVKAVSKFKKQYSIDVIVDYREKDLYEILSKAETVFIYDVPVKERTEIVEYCYRHLINIYFSPEISDIVEISSKHVILDDISLIKAPVKELSFEQRMLKRFGDIVLSFIALVLASPIFLICAIAIKSEDGGHVFFKQKRATKGGKVFEVYKFRTMKENVENYSVVENDDRITKIGRILRKYRIDEVPQFLNIFKGEMSFVGPRPEMLENVYQYTKDLPEFMYRLRVKAGLTGYAQIAGKYNTTPKYKLVLDLMYIENYSLIKDIKIMLQTLIVFFKSDSTESFATGKDPEVMKYEKIMEKYWKDDSNGEN